ncbi:MAG: diamine N-acetyltransferase [Alteromonadaceae bacterium]|jgi:diamine N-acetyltransferase
MNVSLCQINKENYSQVCDLDVLKEQEDYVACNMWSLVEAQFNDGYRCRAITLNEDIVGFLMWVEETSIKSSIWRFMVDQKFQQQGVGRQALQLAIDEIKQKNELCEIEICYHPKNPVAKTFYASFGFIEVGMDEDDDDMLAIIQL